MPENTQRRVVAIVGRPNVGKSALFNRLAGRRIAIVHEESGVTRDRIVCPVDWNGQRFELIDTGGVGLMDRESADDEIVRGMRQQVDVAIQDAAVVIFVTDITEGIVPLDEEVAKLLHGSGRHVIVAANKADNPGLEADADDFEPLGFPVYPIAAIHGRGIDLLMSAVISQLPEGLPVTDVRALKVVVVGRPNVGKSSYINKLLGSDRVIVSDRPGTTRDSIDVPFVIGEGEGARHYLLTDTAGMRKVGHVRTSVERFSLFRAEDSIRRADIAVLMLDAEQGPTVQDKKIAATILEHHKGCVLVVNKWDLASGVKPREYEEALRRELFFLDFTPIVFVSAKSGVNIRKSVEVIDSVARAMSTEVTTGLLNRVLRDAFDRVQPPAVKGHRLKLFYATQTGTQPVWIRLFVNDRSRVPDAYRSYLVGVLRRNFGLHGAPIVLDFKSSHGESSRPAEKNKS